jgi:hypothetical protein
MCLICLESSRNEPVAQHNGNDGESDGRMMLTPVSRSHSLSANHRELMQIPCRGWKNVLNPPK